MGIGEDGEPHATPFPGQIGCMAEQRPADAAADPAGLDIEQDQLDFGITVGLGDLVQPDRPVLGIGRDEHVAGPDRVRIDGQRRATQIEERRIIAPIGLGAQAQVGQRRGLAGRGPSDRQGVRRARDQLPPPCSRATARQPMSRRQKPSGQRIASTAW